MDTQQLTN